MVTSQGPGSWDRIQCHTALGAKVELHAAEIRPSPLSKMTLLLAFSPLSATQQGLTLLSFVNVLPALPWLLWLPLTCRRGGGSPAPKGQVPCPLTLPMHTPSTPRKPKPSQRRDMANQGCEAPVSALSGGYFQPSKKYLCGKESLRSPRKIIIAQCICCEVYFWRTFLVLLLPP